MTPDEHRRQQPHERGETGPAVPRWGTALLDTPVGSLAVVMDDDATLVAAGFCPVDDLLRRLHAGDRTVPVAAESTVAPIARAVVRYFDGDLAAFDDVAVRQSGGAFTEAAWTALRAVRPGEPITYAELATRAGSPGASRAAGQACARNLVAPFIPCHRAVPASGGVGGYAYGAAVKQALLAHERAASSGSRVEPVEPAERVEPPTGHSRTAS